MAGRTSPTHCRRRLARRLRDLRERADFTLESAAKGLDMSKSALGRKETGEVGTSVHEVRSMMDLYDIFEPDLLELARAAKGKGWWRAYGVEDRGYIDLETDACSVRELSLVHVPGLLQTEEYARAVIDSGRQPLPRKTFENFVQVRLIRQQRITDKDGPLELMAVVDEAALWRPIGSAEVMRAQLKHLTKVAQLDTVSLRVLPTRKGAHAGMDGAFTILGFAHPDDRDVLFIAHPAGSVHIDKEGEVREATLIFEHLLAEALPAQASLELVEQVAREL